MPSRLQSKPSPASRATRFLDAPSPTSLGRRTAKPWPACHRHLRLCFTRIRVILVLVETQNITLALPKALLRQVKIVAVNKQTSVSSLLTELLADYVARERRYAGARRRALASLANPPDLGTGGRIGWTRDDLHDRG